MAVTHKSDSLKQCRSLARPPLHLTENDGRVMTSETKRVAKCATYLAMLCHAECKVKFVVNLGINLLDVDCRGNHATRNGHHTG